MIEAFVERLVDALCLQSQPLATKVAVIESTPSEIISRLASAVLGYLGQPSALSTNTRLLEGDKEVPRDRWTSSRIGHGQVIHTELHSEYIDRALARGELLVIDSIEECDRNILLLREALEYRLGARAWVNAYLTANDQTNFGLHSDTHDTLIIQLLGRKQWTVDSAGRDVRPEHEMDMREYELTPGMALVMAGRAAHNVSGVGELTVHLTIGFDRTAGLPYQAAQVSRLLARPDADISDADLVRSKALVEERRTGTSLPYRITGELTDCRWIRWASRLPPAVETAPDGRLTVMTMGRTHEFAVDLSPLVTALTSGLEFGRDRLITLSGLTADRFAEFLRSALEDDIIITTY